MWRVTVALIAFAQGAWFVDEPITNKYLLIATPENSPEKVWYMVLPTGVGSATTDATSTASTSTATTDADASTTTAPSLNALLKDTDSLSKPIGIAVDHARNGLYVADYELGKILRWKLTEDVNLQTLTPASTATEIYSGSYVSWLAVDSIGNLFFSDEDTSTI